MADSVSSSNEGVRYVRIFVYVFLVEPEGMDKLAEFSAEKVPSTPEYTLVPQLLDVTRVTDWKFCAASGGVVAKEALVVVTNANRHLWSNAPTYSAFVAEELRVAAEKMKRGR